MFDRWLKARSSAPVALDLQRHGPKEFQGKTIQLDGCNYTVGGRVRESDQGYSHRLINSASGLCLHLIQFRPEVQHSPEVAWQVSLAKQQANAVLRDQFLRSGEAIPFGVMTAWQAHGGSFELHEIAWGMMGDDAPAPAQAEIQTALALRDRGDTAGAIRQLEQVVLQHPQQTAAWINLAGLYQAQSHVDVALHAVNKALAAEPLYASYHGAALQIAVNCERRHQAMAVYERMQQRFAHVHDYDTLATHAYLRAGQPERAQVVMRSAHMPAEVATALAQTVEHALSARAQLRQLGEAQRASGFDGERAGALVQALEALYTGNEVDPYIAANLGLTLRAAGQPARAAGLILSAAGGIDDRLVPCCWANAAYCLIATGDWRNAMLLLTTAMQVLSQSGTPTPADAPGLAAWIFDERQVLETQNPPASRILQEALADCPDKTLITPEVEHLAALLRQFTEQLSKAA